MEVIIPATPVAHPCTSEKLDILETPPSPDILQNPPPPPYSQWDVEQLIEKSKEVLTGHSEYLASGEDKKEKDSEMLEKITQVESLLQVILNDQSDQTCAMHDLRSQLSDIQTVLKKMHDKQNTVTNEEIQKLTENLITPDEAKRQLEENRVETEVTGETQGTKVVDEKSVRHPICEEIYINNPTPALSAILMAPPVITVSQQSTPTPSNAPSIAPSRNPSCPPSRAASRAVSPSRESVKSNGPSPRLEYNSPEPQLAIRSPKSSFESPKMEEILEEDDDDNDVVVVDDDDDDEDDAHNTSLDRMVTLLSDLIHEASEAVNEPVVGREDLGKTLALNYSDIDFSDITRDIDALGEDESSSNFEDAASEGDENKHENPDRGRSIKRVDKNHKRAKSRNEEIFERGMCEFYEKLNEFSNIVEDLTTDEPVNSGVQDDYPYLQYDDSTADLIRNPSESLADLDDFSQQCRLLTRALILPFLHATHSFMSESLKTSIHSRESTSTTRTFMNLIYWTFLFTLGSLVLDAWLCEVAGRQVIRVVESLKPGRPFGIIASDPDQQDGGFGVLEDGKKKNVKFRTGLKMKAVKWKGAETEVVGGRGGWLKDGVMSLSKKGGRFLTGGGRWCGNKLFGRMTVGKFEEEEFSEDSDEWEIVDFDSSEGEESGVEEDDIEEEDPALSLKRKITNERLRRAGHVNKSVLEEAVKIEEENNADKNDDVSFIEGDIQTFDEITTTTTLKTFIEEPEEYDMDEDEDENDIDEVCDLNIPGSFPAAFQRTPSISIVEGVQRVRSVVLRRPKRNGPFGGSGGFWIMKTRKINRRSITGVDVSSAVLKRSSAKSSPITRKRSSKSLSLPKRIRIRRNSI